MANKYLAQEKRVFDISKFTVVGSPTITDDGILSNCSNGNAVNTKVQLSQLAGKSWAVKGSAVLGSASHSLVKLSSVGNGFYTNFGSVLWNYSTKRIGFNARTGIAGDTNNEGGHITGSSVFEIGDKIYYTLSFDIATGTYTLYADKIDGTTYQGKWTPATDNKELYYMNTHPEYYISLGAGSDNSQYLTTGSIDMKDFSVEIEGETVFTGTKPTHLLERRKEGFDLSKFTVVGSPTITEDGVASGFTTTNYIKTSGFNIGQLKGKSWEIKCKWYFDVNTTDTYNINDILNLSETYHSNGYMGAHTSNKRLRIMITTGVTGASQIFYQESTPITESGWVEQKLTFDVNTGAYTFYNLKPNSITWESREWVATTENKELLVINERPSDCFQIGKGKDTIIGYTPVILPSISVTVDGKEVFTGAKENYYMMRKP